VVRLLPVEAGQFLYRIKSKAEAFERVAKRASSRGALLRVTGRNRGWTDNMINNGTKIAGVEVPQRDEAKAEGAWMTISPLFIELLGQILLKHLQPSNGFGDVSAYFNPFLAR
jgi:hypothetical protein